MSPCHHYINSTFHFSKTCSSCLSSDLWFLYKDEKIIQNSPGQESQLFSFCKELWKLMASGK